MTLAYVYVCAAALVALLCALMQLHLTKEAGRYASIDDLVANNYAFDIVIVGAGTAGCLLAAELARHSSLTVLVLEAGGETRTSLLSLQTVPLLATENLQTRTIDHMYELDPQTTPLEGGALPANRRRSMDVPRGKIVGGR
jgi:choline dehydrogenase-like flavoprotein